MSIKICFSWLSFNTKMVQMFWSENIFFCDYGCQILWVLKLFNTPIQGENVYKDSFEIENNGIGSIKKPSLINSGLPLLDSGTLNLEVVLPNPVPTYGLENGMDYDIRTRG